jgi:hypothetical protein
VVKRGIKRGKFLVDFFNRTRDKKVPGNLWWLKWLKFKDESTLG